MAIHAGMTIFKREGTVMGNPTISKSSANANNRRHLVGD